METRNIIYSSEHNKKAGIIALNKLKTTHKSFKFEQ